MGSQEGDEWPTMGKELELRGAALGKAVSERQGLLLRESAVKGTARRARARALQPRTCQPHLCDFALNLLRGSPKTPVQPISSSAAPPWLPLEEMQSLQLHPDPLSQKGWGGLSSQDVSSPSRGC